MDNKLYTDKSIESLTPLEFTRLRPQVYAGDCTYSTQLLVEIIANAVDEFNLGHGTQIDVMIKRNEKNQYVVTVQDYGQGFIVNSLMPDGKTVLEAAFSVLNTSGKYKEDGVYEGTSLGSFGIGSKITTFLSHWLDVETVRDNKYEKVQFVEGVFKKRDMGGCTKRSGTRVRWSPSEEFFVHPEVEVNKIKNLFEVIVCLCQGLTINLTIDGKTETFFSKNGLNDLLDKVKGTELLPNRLAFTHEENKFKVNLILTYFDNYSSTIIPYVNTGLTDSGMHITQVKTTLTREMNKFFREKGWLKEKDENLSGDDIQEGLYVIFNYTAPNVGYDAQVKSRITAIETKPLVSALSAELQNWLVANEKAVKIIADKALNARKAREAAKKAREAVRNNEKKKKEKVLKFDSKLADCRSKDRAKCEIYITEGDSASGNLKTARDNEYQAVMPVRGKILNCEKATIQEIQKNAEIMTMIDAFGLTIDPKTMKVTYDKRDLRYGKIIIMSDADVSNTAYERLFA